jgi:hypothetical protein
VPASSTRAICDWVPPQLSSVQVPAMVPVPEAGAKASSVS